MKLFRQIIALSFSLLVFVSSSSFTVGMHVCGGKVNAIAFLSNADGCGHKQMPPCHQKLMQGCCEDETLSYQGQGFTVDVTQIHVAPAPFVDIVQSSILLAEIIPAEISTSTKFFLYDPPLRSFDRTVIHQVFLI